jgi:hypothetical protein
VWFKPQQTVVGGILDLDHRKVDVLAADPKDDLYQFHWSPDEKWVAFFVQSSQKPGVSRVYVAPYQDAKMLDHSTWIPITDGLTREDEPKWSPDGNWLYAFSNRDGVRCIWAFPVDRRTKRPSGNPLPVYHSHASRRSLGNADQVSQEYGVALDKIIFNQGEITGNIWLTTLPRH